MCCNVSHRRFFVATQSYICLVFYFCAVSRMWRSMFWLCSICKDSRYLSFIKASQDNSSSSSIWGSLFSIRQCHIVSITTLSNFHVLTDTSDTSDWDDTISAHKWSVFHTYIYSEKIKTIVFLAREAREQEKCSVHNHEIWFQQRNKYSLNSLDMEGDLHSTIFLTKM